MWAYRMRKMPSAQRLTGSCLIPLCLETQPSYGWNRFSSNEWTSARFLSLRSRRKRETVKRTLRHRSRSDSGIKWAYRGIRDIETGLPFDRSRRTKNAHSRSFGRRFHRGEFAILPLRNIAALWNVHRIGNRKRDVAAGDQRLATGNDVTTPSVDSTTLRVDRTPVNKDSTKKRTVINSTDGPRKTSCSFYVSRFIHRQLDIFFARTKDKI